ncbi:MAG: HigA family addiction module antidote protein [Candidatus Marinimicrobia bacterium]|nr:HigA family addiction module antidote protein [Candidatus Neomarinimicrobiota bacterium]
MVRIPTNRMPTHPGEMLLEDFLKPMGVTQKQLSVAIHVPFQRINELVNGKRGITPSTALRFSRFFGNTPDFWMNLQQRWDLYWAKTKEAEDLSRIHSYS